MEYKKQGVSGAIIMVSNNSSNNKNFKIIA